MSLRRRGGVLVTAACMTVVCGARAAAHNGPPYPIISNQIAGAYRVSVWTDPDATDDGTSGGQFWVVVDPAKAGEAVSPDVRARLTIRPLDRPAPARMAQAAAVGGDRSRLFVALPMDHEGPFAVRVEIESQAGQVALDSRVDATYDLRPSPTMLVLYLLPFLIAGGLWVKLLVRRRSQRRPAA